MSNKKLSFKLGQEKNRGELYTRHSNIIENTVVSFEEGQTLFSYSEIDSTKYPYKPYDHTYKTKSSKDARIYIDLSNERIPISSYFSDYSSKLWDLSSGTEFNCGNNGRPIFFSNGVPCPAQFKIETVNRATLGTTPNTFKVSIDATHDNQAIVKLPCNFGICSTAGNTIAKTVTVDISSDTPFILGNGIKVTILFQNGNTQGLSNVTLNVNNTGAKKIKIGNSSNLSTNFIKSGQICHFTYYNNYWYLDSSPEATASQNGLLSINSQQIKGQKDFLDKILLRNGFEFRGPSAVPLASLSGSNIGDSKNGLVTLTLGSIASAVDQGKGCIKLYNNETKTTTLTTYSNDTDTSNQNIYFRNYGSADNYFVTTNTPLKVGGSDDTNGDNPVYISDKGVVTACNGIVVTAGAQTFSGEKTFNGPINIDIQYGGTSGLIENSDNVYKYLAIKNGNDDYIAIDNKCIQKCGQDTELLINPDGGRVSFSEGTFCIDDNGIVTINTETVSTSSDTGALIVNGGIGVAKTSYMTSIFPNTTMSSQLGGFDNIWKHIFSNEYLIHDGENGHFSNAYTGGRIYTETGASSSGSSCYTCIELGNRLSEDEYEGSRAGALTIYGPKKGGVTIETRSDHGNYVRTFYLPSESSSQYAVWSNKEDTSVGGMTYLADGTSNGHEPVYVTAAGRVYPCSGIVVTEGNQTFTGIKTFSNTIICEDTISTQAIFSGNIYSNEHNNYNLGTVTNRWKNIYIADYVNTGTLVLGNTGSSGSQTTTIGYGTQNPETAVSSPVAGRVYFKIIS